MSKIEVDEVTCLVSDVRAEVSTYDAVPGRVVFFVELLLDVRRDILFDVELLDRLGGAVDRVLLHVLTHVRILDHCLTVRHFRLLVIYLVIIYFQMHAGFGS